MSEIIKFFQCILELFIEDKKLISLIMGLLVLLTIYLKYKNEINNFVKKCIYITKNFVNKIKYKRINKQIKKCLKYKIKKYYNCNINQFISKECPSLLNYLLKQKEKEYGGLYNFISKEYPGVLKEYTEKEIIKHDSIYQFISKEDPDVLNECIKQKIIKYKDNPYDFLHEEYSDLLKEICEKNLDIHQTNYQYQFQLLCVQCPIIVAILCIKNWYCIDHNIEIIKIAEKMLDFTNEYYSVYVKKDHLYFGRKYFVKLAWKKLRYIYLLRPGESWDNKDDLKKIEEIFNKQREIEMKDKYEKYINNIEDMKKYFDIIKNIIQDEYEDEYNEHTINIDGNLKKLEELKIQNENIEDYVIYIKDIREILSTQLSKLKENNEQSEYNLKFNYILYKSCNFIQAFFEELAEYSVKLTKNNYIKAHKAFINNIIEDTEFYELINFGRAEYYVSHYPYKADVFLYDIDIDNIDKNDVQKVFTLYQELCTEVLKIYLSGKLKADNIIDKYIQNINKLYDLINKNNNEMLKFRAQKLKFCLEEFKNKFDNTLAKAS